MLWLLAIFSGLLGLAIRLVAGGRIERGAGLTAAVAAALGGVVGSIIVLAESTSENATRFVAAAAIVAIGASLVGLLARHAESTDDDGG